MAELFKPIKDYEGLYEISNLGRVKSLKFNKEKILKPRVTKGYYFVSLCKNGNVKNFQVHRLIAQAFIPNPENKPNINHKDGNRQNNSIENLEWCTQKENIQHAFRTKLINRKPLTEQQKECISISTKKAMKRADVQEKLHKPRPQNKGMKRSEETREKMRKAWDIRKTKGAI